MCIRDRCLDDGVEQKFAEVGAKIVRPRFWFHPINPADLIPFLQLFFLCRRERFDLVATHTSKGGMLGRIAARAAGIPKILHHAHGFAFRDTQAKWVQRIYIFLERLAARACDLIAVSYTHLVALHENRRYRAELAVFLQALKDRVIC